MKYCRYFPILFCCLFSHGVVFSQSSTEMKVLNNLRYISESIDDSQKFSGYNTVKYVFLSDKRDTIIIRVRINTYEAAVSNSFSTCAMDTGENYSIQLKKCCINDDTVKKFATNYSFYKHNTTFNNSCSNFEIVQPLKEYKMKYTRASKRDILYLFMLVEIDNAIFRVSEINPCYSK
jgi:hypothetical protein